MKKTILALTSSVLLASAAQAASTELSEAVITLIFRGNAYSSKMGLFQMPADIDQIDKSPVKPQSEVCIALSKSAAVLNVAGRIGDTIPCAQASLKEISKIEDSLDALAEKVCQNSPLNKKELTRLARQAVAQSEASDKALGQLAQSCQ